MDRSASLHQQNWTARKSKHLLCPLSWYLCIGHQGIEQTPIPGYKLYGWMWSQCRSSSKHLNDAKMLRKQQSQGFHFAKQNIECKSSCFTLLQCLLLYSLWEKWCFYYSAHVFYDMRVTWLYFQILVLAGTLFYMKPLFYMVRFQHSNHLLRVIEWLPMLKVVTFTQLRYRWKMSMGRGMVRKTHFIIDNIIS